MLILRMKYCQVLPRFIQSVSKLLAIISLPSKPHVEPIKGGIRLPPLSALQH